MIQFEVDGVAYQARNMDAFVQWDVLALLTPILTAGFGEFLALIDLVKQQQSIASINDLPRGQLFALIIGMDKEELLPRVQGISREFAKTTPADRRFVIASCLSLCQRKIAGANMGWSDVWNVQANRAMHEDINSDFWLMGKIAFGVLSNTPSFARFFPAVL